MNSHDKIIDCLCMSSIQLDFLTRPTPTIDPKARRSVQPPSDVDRQELAVSGYRRRPVGSLCRERQQRIAKREVALANLDDLQAIVNDVA